MARRVLSYFLIYTAITASLAGYARARGDNGGTRSRENSVRPLKTSGGRRARSCPKDRPYIDCSISPCKAERLLGKQCEVHPEATCVNELCGGCVAKHFVDDKEVHCGKDTNVICELQNSSLSCPINHVMVVKHANYGRTDPYTCRHSYDVDAMHNNTSCLSSNATQIVRELCEGRTVCWPDVSSQVFGDPCYKIYKYLKVDYECMPIRSYLYHKEPEFLVMNDTGFSDGGSSYGSSSSAVLSAEWLILISSLIFTHHYNVV